MIAKMNLGELRKAIKAVKSFISVDTSRPIFCKVAIHFDKEKQTGTVVALDGFRMAVRSIEAAADEDFSVHITKELPYGDDEEEVKIEKTGSKDDLVLISTMFCTIRSIQPEEEEFKYKNAIPHPKNKYKIAFNPKYLMDAIKSCKPDAGKPIILEFDLESNTSPAIIKTNDTDFRMVFPVRLFDDGESDK